MAESHSITPGKGQDAWYIYIRSERRDPKDIDAGTLARAFLMLATDQLIIQAEADLAKFKKLKSERGRKQATVAAENLERLRAIKQRYRMNL